MSSDHVKGQKRKKNLFKKNGAVSYARVIVFCLFFGVVGLIVLKYILAGTSTCASPGQSIVKCISQPGDQELIIKNGTYTGGEVSAPHSKWLILKAETQGGVT